MRIVLVLTSRNGNAEDDASKKVSSKRIPSRSIYYPLMCVVIFPEPISINTGVFRRSYRLIRRLKKLGWLHGSVFVPCSTS